MAMPKTIEEALEAYWSAAYNEGKYDLTTDDGKAQEALSSIQESVALLAGFAKHDSWRCVYYSECHCGLNDLADRLGIPRIPYPTND